MKDQLQGSQQSNTEPISKLRNPSISTENCYSMLILIFSILENTHVMITVFELGILTNTS